MIRLALLLLLLLLPAWFAQAAELKMAAWNLEWLTLRPPGDPGLPEDVKPKRPEDIALLRRYAELLNADVVAFSEVDGPEIAARVFEPRRYRIHITADAVTQRAGFAVRQGIDFTANPDVTALDVQPEARYRLRSGADVTLHLAGGPLRLLAVHLKSGCRDAPLSHAKGGACATLARQVAPLGDWIAARGAEGMPFLVMGDFNRWMEGRDAFLSALQQAAPLLRPDAGMHSPCWGGSGFLDHILIGGPARAWTVPDSFRVLVYRETDPIWKERLSDHCPISVQLRAPG